MDNKFNINKVQDYFLAIANNNKERADDDFNNMPAKNFNIRSIFSIFDTNKDGKITRQEFNNVSEEEYNAFVDKLKEYNEQNNRASANNSIWNYAKMENYLNDHISPNEITEDEVLCDDLVAFYGEHSKDQPQKNNNGTNLSFEEVFNLKDMSQMTKEEIIAELNSYGIEPKSDNIKSLTRELGEARRKRAKYDIGSDAVDGHVGTFIQNRTNVCTVLAIISGMKDDELRQMFVFDEGHNFDNPMIDENGKKYWNIKFPIDKDNSKIVCVTEDEIKSGEIQIEEYGEIKTIKEFPEGDGDITAIAMAFVKRFGSDIVQSGEWSYITKNRFIKPEDTKYKDNQYMEMITDYKDLEGGIISNLSMDELKRKGFESKPLKDEDLSWIPNEEHRQDAQRSEGFIYTLENGQKVCISRHGIFLENGTKFEQHHAMVIKQYDEKTNELIISGNEFGNISEVRIPVELLQFCETASLPGTPGVDKTPDPGLIDRKI